MNDWTGEGQNVIIEVVTSPAGHEVVYIHQGSEEVPTVLRICRVKVVEIQDNRNKSTGSVPKESTSKFPAIKFVELVREPFATASEAEEFTMYVRSICTNVNDTAFIRGTSDTDKPFAVWYQLAKRDTPIPNLKKSDIKSNLADLSHLVEVEIAQVRKGAPVEPCAEYLADVALQNGAVVSILTQILKQLK